MGDRRTKWSIIEAEIWRSLVKLWTRLCLVESNAQTAASGKRELKDFQEKKVDQSGPRIRGWEELREEGGTCLPVVTSCLHYFWTGREAIGKYKTEWKVWVLVKIFPWLLGGGQEFPKRTLIVFQVQGSCGSLVGTEATGRIEKESD